ncbi:hypothetical protein ACLOJK_005428 [Asimina triloba]
MVDDNHAKCVRTVDDDEFSDDGRERNGCFYRQWRRREAELMGFAISELRKNDDGSDSLSTGSVRVVAEIDKRR